MRRKCHEHAGIVNAVVWKKESQVAFTACVDGCVRVWDVRAMKTLHMAVNSVLSLAARGFKIAASSADGRVQHYDQRAGRL